jgi:hypothetical protein
MNKKLYSFAIFFLALSAICGLLQSIIGLKIGPDIYNLDFFIRWSVWVGTISLITSLLLLKYYQFRRYWFAFYSGLVTLITNLIYLIVTCFVLITRQEISYYKPLGVVLLCFSVLYAVSLMLTGSKLSWLKAAGLYAFISGIIMLLSVVQISSAQPEIFERIMQLIPLFNNLFSFLLIAHFLTEIKSLKRESVSIPDSIIDMLKLLKPITLMITIIFGILISYQSYSQLYWAKKSFEKTKALSQLFEARIFVNTKGDTLRYRLLKPLNYDPKKPYPLVVSLPYGGQPPTDTLRQVEGAAAAELLMSENNRKRYPSFIFVPNCPPGSGWGGIPDYPSIDTLVYKAIIALDTEFSIDTSRRYVTGVSRGGYGAWHFICTRPDLFAAAIPVCGGDDPALASKIHGVSVWAFHGAKDQNVPVSNSRNMVLEMKKAGERPKYTEYPDEGHSIWHIVSKTEGLWDWLFAQKRNQ